MLTNKDRNDSNALSRSFQSIVHEARRGAVLCNIKAEFNISPMCKVHHRGSLLSGFFKKSPMCKVHRRNSMSSGFVLKNYHKND